MDIMGCAAHRGSRSAQSPSCPSPKGESFVDRPTSNSSSEREKEREKERTIPGKSSSRETPRKEMPRISSVTQFSTRCDQSTVPKNERQYIKVFQIRRAHPSVERKVNFLKNIESQFFQENFTGRYRKTRMPLCTIRFPFRFASRRFCCDLCFLSTLS